MIPSGLFDFDPHAAGFARTIGVPPDCLTVAAHLAVWAVWKKLDEVEAEFVIRPVWLDEKAAPKWLGCNWAVFPDGAAEEEKRAWKR